MNRLRFVSFYPMKAERAIRRAEQVMRRSTELGSLPLTYRHLDSLGAAATQYFHRDRFANGLTAKSREEIVGILNWLTVDPNKDVANKQAAFCRGPIFFEPKYQQSVGLFAIKRFSRSFRNLNRLCANT